MNTVPFTISCILFISLLPLTSEAVKANIVPFEKPIYLSAGNAQWNHHGSYSLGTTFMKLVIRVATHTRGTDLSYTNGTENC